MISSVDPTDLLTDGTSSAKDKTYKSAFFITAPVFIGYACCFSLQHRLGNVFGLADGAAGNSRSYYFGIGTSFVYFFNLIFRVVGHNLLFGCFSPRVRVVISLASMIVGQTMLSIVSMAKSPPHLAWVFISYAFCGVCEGSYCPNMFTVVNNLGETRQQIVTAIPFGVSLITILGFALFSIGMPFQYCYMFTAVTTFGAIILYLIKIYPVANSSASTFSFKDFFNDFKNIKEWFPKIWGHCLVFIINMFCLSLFNPGCTLYAFNERVHYKLFGFTIPHDAFILTCNIGNFLGDLLSRIVMDKKRIINPIYFFILLIFGISTNLALIPEITPLASFVFGWANGGLYTQTTKLIGRLFVEKYHLTSMSTWLFVGDVGSTSGSNCVQPMRPILVGIKQLEY